VPRFDYVTVGHVTVDVLADLPPLPLPRSATTRSPGARQSPDTARSPDGTGLRQPGGGAFYSALQAARLGLRTLILTRGVPREIEELLEPYRAELHVRIEPAASTTTLQTRGSGHTRIQRLTAWAGPISQPAALDTAILHLAPIARETPRHWQGHSDFIGLTPQGLLRTWEADGVISPAPPTRELLPERCDALVLSRAEWELCGGSFDGARGTDGGCASGVTVAVTAGSEPTAILPPGGAPLRVPVPPIASPRDDLGAGDVFAAAFFTALHDGLPDVEAAAFANAAAAVRIAGGGPAAIGDRHAIEARLLAATPPFTD
jgi:sugar/nucleoside kinase (ribokinase family)